MNAPAPVRTRDPEDRIYNGLEFAVLEIEDAERVLSASIKTLRENHTSRHMVGIKTAAEQIAKVARQIDALSGSLVTTATTHVNRRSRVS